MLRNSVIRRFVPHPESIRTLVHVGVHSCEGAQADRIEKLMTVDGSSKVVNIAQRRTDENDLLVKSISITTKC